MPMTAIPQSYKTEQIRKATPQEDLENGYNNRSFLPALPHESGRSLPKSLLNIISQGARKECFSLLCLGSTFCLFLSRLSPWYYTGRIPLMTIYPHPYLLSELQFYHREIAALSWCGTEWTVNHFSKLAPNACKFNCDIVIAQRIQELFS